MDTLKTIEALITPPLGAMGYELVRLRLTGGRRPVLQIMAERQDGRGISLDNCAEISREISAILDVADPIAEAYSLEVSSPGIDRPLTRLKDFSRYAGFEARIELSYPVGGQKRYRGHLLGTEDETIRLQSENGEVRFPFAAVHSAKLILNDALLAAAAENPDRHG